MTDIFLERYGMSFEEVAARFRPFIKKRAFALVQHHEDAEDITQQVFLRLYQRPDLFDNNREFGAWVNRIATNAARDLLRKRTTHKECYTVQFDEANMNNNYSVVGSRNPENRYITRILAREVLERMEPKYAVILQMYSEGLTQKDISRVTGIPEGTVKQRFYRAQEQALEIRRGN